MRNPSRLAFALLLAAGTLTGCVEMVVGGAVVGTLSASDRRTLGAQTEDAAINVKGETRVQSLTGTEGHVNITSYNRRVLLTGEVRDEAMRTAVLNEVRAIDGVANVIDEMVVAPPASYTSRSNDALLTTRSKGKLVEAKDISAISFKVVTERATVYLMGRVTQKEGEIASEAVRSVPGVQKVVKVFEYINDTELKTLQPAPAAR
jgi:osmotically-inducible protein OsmY